MRLPPSDERGTALLSVLLLVAVMAVIAATALDRLGLSTRLAANVASAQQSRWWLDMGEQVALAQLARADEADGRAFAQVLGVERTVDLPDGQQASLRLDDATHCFNLNSLVSERDDGLLRANPRAMRQFAFLLEILGMAEFDASGLAARTVDAIDSDGNARPYGSETGKDGARLPNRAFASASEWTVVEGVDEAMWERMAPWLCALPDHELTNINIQTLPPERAALVAMLDPDALSVGLVESRLRARPASGFRSLDDFWNNGGWDPSAIPGNVKIQASEDTSFVSLTVSVGLGDLTLSQRSLIERTSDGPRLRGRLWGAGAS